MKNQKTKQESFSTAVAKVEKHSVVPIKRRKGWEREREREIERETEEEKEKEGEGETATLRGAAAEELLLLG